jgi:hypothetical protein
VGTVHGSNGILKERVELGAGMYEFRCWVIHTRELNMFVIKWPRGYSVKNLAKVSTIFK